MSQAGVDNFQAMECTGFNCALGERCHLHEGHKGDCAGSYGVTWKKAMDSMANREDQKVKDYMDSTAPSFEQQIMPGEAGKLLERLRSIREYESTRVEKFRRLETLLISDPLIREFLQLRAEFGL